MADQSWLEVEDQFVLDGADYRVAGRLLARADRATFQCLTVIPQLGGEPRMLLQLEEGVLEAREIEPEALAGPRVELDGRTFALRWDSEVRTERKAAGGPTRFGRGRCAWYAAEDGSVAVLVVERYDRDACVGAPLAPSRIDLRFTQGLRKGRG